MKLQKLVIKNFRWLKGDQNIIDFSGSDIIFLIGQNNIGKSSFLRAYEFFVNSRQNALISHFYNYDSSIPIEIEWEFIKETDDDTDDDLSGDKGKEPDWINKWVDPSTKLVRVRKIWRNPDQSFEKETYDPFAKEWVTDGFWWLHQKFQKYTPTPILINAMETENTLEEKVNKLISDEFLKKAEADHKGKYEIAIQSIRDLQESILGVKELWDYNNAINHSFSEVFFGYKLEITSKWDKIKPESLLAKDHSINIKKDGTTREESFAQNGHGIIRQALFNFIAFLKRNTSSTKKDYLILFEEPELFLHPKIAFRLRKSLYDLVNDSPYQILCASHSPLMIDVSKPHSSIVRVTKDEQTENTKTFQIWDEIFQESNEMKNFVQMINRFNPHVCEVFYADKVMLVEGDTEAIFYRQMLETFCPEKEIFVLNTWSKTNIPFFQEILTHFHIKQYVIHDLDSETCFDKEWKERKNSAWTLNQSIWDNIRQSNWLSKWYIHQKDFESHYGYEKNNEYGKPLSAYNFAKEFLASGKTIDDISFLWQIIEDIPGKFEFNEKLIELKKNDDVSFKWERLF